MKIYLGALLIILCFACISFISVSFANEALLDENISYSFLQSAVSSRVELNEDNTYTIFLRTVSPYVNYFSAAPNRDEGMMGMEEFLNFWKNINAQSTFDLLPNASLSGISKKGESKMITIVFELNEAEYNRGAQTLKYRAKLLSDDVALIGNGITLEHPILFIDDVCLSCW